jgi:hypothetical protein
LKEDAMRHYRLKVILLSLGVLIGYGSAAARAFYWHERGHGWYGGDGSRGYDHCHERGASAEPGKPTPG